MTDSAVAALTEVAEKVKAEEQPVAKPEPVWNLSQVLRALRKVSHDNIGKEGEEYGDNALIDFLCELMEIPNFDHAGRSAVRTNVLGT